MVWGSKEKKVNSRLIKESLKERAALLFLFNLDPGGCVGRKLGGLTEKEREGKNSRQ